jgi:CHAD domain-containing protein
MISDPMSHSGELLSSFGVSWKNFSEAWKKARGKASEKSVHHLRVSARRLIAILELTHSLSKKGVIPKSQKRFKKVLKRMGPLRDVQVQLQGISHLKQSGLIVDFKRTLERRERREIEAIQDDLRSRTKRRLNEGVKDVRTEFARLDEKLDDARVQQTVERALKSRQNEFMRKGRQFDPSNGETLHEMRIALKKLRYTLEAAQPVLGNSATERVREMQGFQQLLGDTRDTELLRNELEKWASKKGKKIAVVPTLEQLDEQREALRKKITEAALLEHISEPKTPKPKVEKTKVAAPETNEQELSKNSADH